MHVVEPPAGAYEPGAHAVQRAFPATALLKPGLHNAHLISSLGERPGGQPHTPLASATVRPLLGHDETSTRGFTEVAVLLSATSK